MAGKNQVTLTFAGDDKSLQRTFDKVGAGAKKMGRETETGLSKAANASKNLGRTAKGLQGALGGLVATGAGVKMMMEGDIVGGLLMLEGGFGRAALGAAKFALVAGQHIASFVADMGRAAAAFVIHSGRVVLGWITMGAQAMVNAGRMAAAWLIGLGPIGLVIAAIGAVIGILMLCGVSLDDLKNAAAAVWRWIARNWPLLLAILTGPFGLAVLAIYRHRDKIVSALRSGFATVKNLATSAANWIIGKFMGVVGFFQRLPGTIGNIFSRLGSALVGGIKSVWNNTIGGFGFDVPSWIPGIGGRSFRIPRLHQGGIVPGPPGADVLTVLQAGERVSRRGAGGGLVLTVNVAGSIRSDRELVRLIRDEFDRGGLR
jgi:hypothetical protein